MGCLLVNEEPGSTATDFTHIIWQIVYMMLWLVWVTGNVAASVLARRFKPFLCELGQLRDLGLTRSPTPSLSQSRTPGNQPCPIPQTVGMPVQHVPSNQASVPAAGLAVPPHGPVQVGNPDVVQGRPVSE